MDDSTITRVVSLAKCLDDSGDNFSSVRDKCASFGSEYTDIQKAAGLLARRSRKRARLLAGFFVTTFWAGLQLRTRVASLTGREDGPTKSPPKWENAMQAIN